MKPFVKWPGGKTEELNIILENVPPIIGNYFEPFVGGGAVYFGINNCSSYYINDKSQELINLYNDIKRKDVIFLSTINEIDRCWKLLEEITENHLIELQTLYELFSVDGIGEARVRSDLASLITDNADEFNGMLSPEFTIDKIHFLVEMQRNLIRKMKRMKDIEREKGALSLQDVKKNLETGLKSGLYMHFRYLYNHVDSLGLSSHFVSAIYYFIREYTIESRTRNEFLIIQSG